jgi:hypothetical protein
MEHDAAQRLHISAQRIIISLPFPICSHIVAQLVHISAHIPHILGDIGLMRIMYFMAVSHISAQSCIMHIISADIFMSLFMHFIIVSPHIAIQRQHSSIQFCISFERSIVIMVLLRFGFCHLGWQVGMRINRNIGWPQERFQPVRLAQLRTKIIVDTSRWPENSPRRLIGCAHILRHRIRTR